MFGRKRKLDDFSSEIGAHLEIEVERLRSEGLSEKEARATARRSFGNVALVEERFYESSRWIGWDHFWQDVRYALRTLRKSPGFTATAVLTMALGIGATTAIFSVVDATLLHPLPYPQPEQLVSVEDDLPGVGVREVGVSVPEWHDMQSSGIFDYVSPIGGGDINLTGASQPARIRFLSVAPNYFALLGVKPQLGRSFDPDDQTPGFTLEGLISDGLWKRAFGGDPHILGTSLRLDNDLYRVIGVMPPGYHDPGRTSEERNVEIWLASGFAAAPAPPPQRNLRIIPETIARIKPGLTIAAAQSRVDALVASLQKEFPNDYPAQSAWTVRLVPLQERVVGDVRQSLMLLLGAVGLVLLIGCVNVANLLLARASARGREMALRQALGAGRARLTRQLLTEGVLLSLLGGIAGLAILFCTQGFLARLVPDSLPRLNEVSINSSVLLFALGAALVAGAIFGLAPAFHAGRPDLTFVLKQQGRGSTGSGEQARTRRVLVVTEFALSLVLMIAAGLLLRSFADLLNVSLGFQPQNVMAVRVWLPIPNDPETDIYKTAAQEAPFLREVLRRARTLPGVKDAAVGDLATVPLGHDRNDLNPFPLIVEGRETPGKEAPLVNGSIVTPEYFHLLGMTLLRGRLFGEFDDEKAPQVAVINEALARTYWPDERSPGPAPPAKQCARRRNQHFLDDGGRCDRGRSNRIHRGIGRTPNLYELVSAARQRSGDICARAAGPGCDSGAVARAGTVRQPGTPGLRGANAQRHSVRVSFRTAILDGNGGSFRFDGVATRGPGDLRSDFVSCVSERTHEIGIRLALGADKRSILRMVLRQGLGLAIAGAVVGLVGAVIVSHLMSGLLYGVRPTDPLTFVGVAFLLMGVAVLACYIPARRAIRVDPLVALRHE